MPPPPNQIESRRKPITPPPQPSTSTSAAGVTARDDPSDDNYTSSDHESDYEFPDPQLVRKIPLFCRCPPKLNSWLYKCPDFKRCGFKIDLMRVVCRDEDGNRMHLTLGSPEMQDCIFPRISDHHRWHMRRAGVQYVVIREDPLKTVLRPCTDTPEETRDTDVEELYEDNEGAEQPVAQEPEAKKAVAIPKPVAKGPGGRRRRRRHDH